MSFLVSNQSFPAFYDQNLQGTTRIKGISTAVVSITGFTPTASSVTLKTITVNGVNVPTTASGIPGDIVFVQPMAALGAGPTALGQAYVSAANTVTVPFIAFAAAGAIATQNYLVTVFHLAQPTGLDS